MILFTKAVFVMMISLIISVCFGYVLINILKKKNFNQRLSIYLEERHESKKNTPTMGGLIFIIPTLVVILLLFIFDKINYSSSLMIVIITFVSYSIIGFIDDYLIIKRNDNCGLTPWAKFMMQLVVAIIFFYIFH